MTWPPRSIKSIEKALETLRESVAERPDSRSDDEQIWLTRFLVVRAVGYLEQVVNECFRGYIEQKSGGMVKTFALSWFERSRNPSVDNLTTLVGRLDSSLRDDLEKLLTENDSQRSRDLMLLVDRRHKIAHGMNEGLTTQRALTLLQTVDDIAAWFILNLDPDASRRALKASAKR